MKRLAKRLLQFGPILALIALGIYTAYQRDRIDALLHDPNGLVWRSDATRLTVRASEKKEGTLSRHEIRVLRDDGSLAHESRFEIDWNAGLSGGGFVRAMQADADPDLEVVAWAGNADASNESRRPFFLDHVKSELLQRPFSEGSDEAHDLARRWTQVNVVRNLEITVAIGLVAVYYVLFGLVAGLLALVRRMRRRGAAAQR